MRIRTRIAATILAIGTGAGALAFTGGAAMAATSATVTCKTTVTHHHSVTSKGTVSDYTLRKSGCGKNYRETETGTTESASGAHSSYTWTKVMSYPCWYKTEVRDSTSAKGTTTETVTSSGNCG